MRVAVDFKAVSSEAAMRGMGRYTQQQIREVLKYGDIEVFLLMHGAVPPENVLFDWKSFPNVRMVPVSVDGHDLDYRNMPSHDKVLAYSKRLQELFTRLKIDVYHNTVPFMYPYHSAITVCPVVTTFYDAIPLIFPSHYFGLYEQRLHYLRCLENVTASRRVISISKSATRDLSLYTGYPASKTHLAYPVIEGVFRPIGEGDQTRILSRGGKLSSVRLPEKFVLSVTGVHRSKNISLVVEGFLAAAERLREDWGLVIVLPNEWAEEAFRGRFSASPRIVTVCDVSDDELCLLYNRAEMVMQPSMYEGFGYPVAEAMNCGAAVIATNTASIPEIAGNGAILVPPNDPALVAAAILRLARDSQLRSDLKRKALERSGLFRDLDALGAATVSAYREAVGSEEPKRPRVAVWSSMPPLDCGVADYTSELVRELARTHDVSVCVDGTYQPTPTGTEFARYRHPEDLQSEAEPIPSIFQVGARNYQEYMYPHIRKRGGTMVLHDVSMGLGFYFLAQSSNRLAEFEDEIVWPEGERVISEYADLHNLAQPVARETLEEFFGRNKMLQWLIGPSDRILVHTPSLRDRVLQSYPHANVDVVRMGVTDTIPLQRHRPYLALRQALGIGPEGVLVGSFGIVDRVKRLGSVIGAFSDIVAEHPGSVMVVVGRCYDDGYKSELIRQIDDSGLGDRILLLGHVPPPAFDLLMGVTDIVVNLRAPDRMGLSAVLIRALAAAKPVVISDIAEWDLIPADACVRVPGDDGEREVLARKLAALARDPLLRARLGVGARQWFLHNATVRTMADDYLAKTPMAPECPVLEGVE